MHAGWAAKQLAIRMRACVEDQLTEDIRLVAGVDVSFDLEDESTGAVAIVVCKKPSMKVVFEQTELVRTRMPYVPGFLGFREAPVILPMLERLRGTEFWPDVLLVDGNGILHPRGCGLATQIGVLADIPAIGCAKSLYSIDGLHERTVRERASKELTSKGDFIYLDGESGQRYGAAVLSTEHTKKPIYVSVGHRVSLETAIDIVQQSCLFRVPEPVRQADKISRQAISDKREENAK